MLPSVGSLAIASVTAVLKDLLGNGLVAYSDITGVGDVSVSALPPDRITAGAEEHNQLNLFMYRVTPHSSLGTEIGKRRLVPGDAQQVQLRLNLYYLLTAYGMQDFHAEILLGCAMHVLNTTPVLSTDMIREALGSSAAMKAKHLMSPARAALSASDLTSQFEQIKITPQFLSFEEMSKLWSALQARYRPSVTYEVSAVTISGRN